LVKEFIILLEKQISSEQEEKQVVENELQEIVGQKRRACTIDTASTSSASKELVAAGGTRRIKRVKVVVKVAPAYYVPAEEEPLEAWCPSHASSGILVTKNTTLTSNEDANPGSSDGVSAVTTATRVPKARKGQHTFGERFKDLMTFKAEFGHCNVPATYSRNYKHYSLGLWCSNVRMSYKTIKNGGHRLSKAEIKRLENAGFQWSLYKTFDERFKDLIAFKAEYGHCNVPQPWSRNNKHYSLGGWCIHMRKSIKAIKEGGTPKYRLSKAGMKRLENAGFEWNLCKKSPFDARFDELMAFKVEFGHCNVPRSRSKTINNEYLSLGRWCRVIRKSYKAIKEGVILKHQNRLSKADTQRLENAGFGWNK